MNIHLKRALVWLGAALVTFVIILFCLLFTGPGNQLIAYTASNLVEGLNIRLHEGRFFYDDPFDVSYQSAQLDVEFKALRLDLDLGGCARLCLENLSLEKGLIGLKTAEMASDETQPQGAFSPLPFDIAANQIELMQLDIIQGEQTVHIKGLTTAFSLRGNVLSVPRLYIAEARLTSAKSSANEINAKSAKPLQSLPALEPVIISLPLELHLGDFALGSLTLAQGEEVTQAGPFSLAARFKDNTVSVTEAKARYGDYTLSGNAKVALFDDNPLEVSLQLSEPNNNARVDLNGSLPNFQLRASVTGDYPLELSAGVDLTEVNYPFELTLSHPAWVIESEQSTLVIKPGSVNANGNAEKFKLLQKGALQLGAYPQIVFDTELNAGLSGVSISRAQILVNDTEARLTGNIDWQQGISAKLDTALTHLKAQYFTDMLKSDVSGTLALAFRAEGQHWQLEVNDTRLSGTLNGYPLALESDLSVDDTLKGTINTLELSAGDNILSAKGTVDEHWQLDGRVALNDASQLLGGLSGKGSGHYTLAGPRNNPIADWELTLNEIGYQGITAHKITSRGQFDASNVWQANVELMLENAEYDSEKLDSLTFSLSGDANDHRLALDLRSSRLDVHARLKGGIDQTRWQGVIANAGIRAGSVEFIADPDTALTAMSTGALELAPHCWRADDGALCVGQMISDPQTGGALQATMVDLPLDSVLDPVKPALAGEGTLDGSVDIKWSGGKLRHLESRVTGQGAGLIAERDNEIYSLPLESLNLSLTSSEQRANVLLRAKSSLVGEISGELALDDPAGRRLLNGQLSLSAMELANLLPFIDPLERLGGRIEGQLNIAGSLDKPVLAGHLEASNLALAGPTLPLMLIDSTLKAELKDERIRISGALHDQDAGQLALEGDIRLESSDKFAMNIKGKQFSLSPAQGIHLKVSPDLQLAMNQSTLTARGSVAVPYGRIKVDELPQGAVQVSDDEVILDAKVKSAKTKGMNYDARVKLLLGEDVRVDAFGLRTRLGGDMSVTMQPGTPMLASGELNLIEGQYRAFGQDLLIRKGQIGFSGAIDRPYLDIQAIRNPDTTADDVIAGLNLSGNATKPRLDVFSEPAMDKSAALSYLLNGRPLGEGNSSGDALLTQMLLAQGASQGEGIVSRMGESVGLSDVTLNSVGSGDDTQLEIAGYLAPGVQLKYRVGIFDSLSEVAVRYQLFSRFYIEFTSGLYDTLDVLYKFDVD